MNALDKMMFKGPSSLLVLWLATLEAVLDHAGIEIFMDVWELWILTAILLALAKSKISNFCEETFIFTYIL